MDQDCVQLNRLLFDTQRAEGLAAYRADPAAYLDRYRLSPALRTAVERTDIAALYRAGANPYLLRFYCVNQGIGEQDYLDAMHAIAAAETGGAHG